MRRDEFPIVDKFAKDKVNDVLDKIRAEIKQDYEDLDAYEKYDLDALPSFMVRVFGIFDKYRKEQTEE